MDLPADFVPTKVSALKDPQSINYVSVKHESYKRKNKTPKGDSTKTAPLNHPEDKEFNVRKAKQEIIKFGTSGFDTQKKEEAKIQLAIKLGAKPPKNKYKNYKQLLAERAATRKVQESTQNFQQLGKNSLGKSLAKGKSFDRKRRKNHISTSILDVYGKVKPNTVK